MSDSPIPSPASVLADLEAILKFMRAQHGVPPSLDFEFNNGWFAARSDYSDRLGPIFARLQALFAQQATEKATLTAEIDRLCTEAIIQHDRAEAADARATHAEAQLHAVDQVLDRRDALSQVANRIDKILLAIKLASVVDPKGELARLQATLQAAEAERDALRTQLERFVDYGVLLPKQP